MTLKLIKTKKFANGEVHLMHTEDGYPIEVTDTFLPAYTKDAIGRKQNILSGCELGSRSERWMIGVSVASGCPIGCKFCSTGQLKKWRQLRRDEIIEQFHFIRNRHPKISARDSKELKVNYTRMGDSFLSIEEVQRAISTISYDFPDTHHYVSTIGIKGSDFSWIKGKVTLQISLHSLDEERRNWLIPYRKKMSIEELGQIRTNSDLKTTVNLTLVDNADFDIEKMKQYFDPKYFFIKLSPINTNDISDGHNLGTGIITGQNLI